MKTSNSKRLEVICWSIAFPGFGQLLNRKYVKAILFFIFEVMINVGGKVNLIIVDSFLLETKAATMEADYGWLMFYPCIYVFAIWDAYRDASEDELPSYMFIPFVMAAYVGTLGVIYSSKAHISQVYIGPVFLPIIAMIVGFFAGLSIRKIICRRSIRYDP